MKKFTSYIKIFLLLIFCFGINIKAQDGLLTNDEIISLNQAGLDKLIIIKKIQSAKSNFDLSIDALIKLKKENIPDEIVAAMLEAKSGKSSSTSADGKISTAIDPNDPLSPHGYGVYLFQEKNGGKVLTQLTPSVSSQNKTSGLFTTRLTYGIVKVKVKANLPETAANLQINDSKPVFYFYLDAKSGGMNTASGIPSNPNEFALVKFNVHQNTREVTISQSNAYTSKGGLSEEFVVDFNAENIGNGVFKITPKTNLEAGEYAFYLINSGNSNTGSGVGAKFFDFGIR